MAGQRTFLLRWNPNISCHKVRDFVEAYKYRFDNDFYYNWSVYDYKHAHIGDRFFMMKSGSYEINGIVMAGTFISEPFLDEDWNGKGREVYYMDMKVEEMADIKNGILLATMEQLERSLPEINWLDGHSGEMITEMQASAIDELIEFNNKEFNRKLFLA